MFGAKNNIHRFILLLSVSSFSIDPVSPIKCYQCSSKDTNECVTKPEQPRFQVECKLPSTTQNTAPKTIEFQCMVSGTVPLGKNPDQIEITRGCILKDKECDPNSLVKMSSEPSSERRSLKISWCDLCDSDLCNSTALISAKIWILTLSLVVHLQMHLNIL